MRLCDIMGINLILYASKRTLLGVYCSYISILDYHADMPPVHAYILEIQHGYFCTARACKQKIIK